jgi:hypothetical protein
MKREEETLVEDTCLAIVVEKEEKYIYPYDMSKEITIMKSNRELKLITIRSTSY